MPRNFEEVAAQAEKFGQWDSRLKLEIPFFAEILGRHGAKRVCDAGCGAGRHTLALAQMGFSMTGLDPNDEYLALARVNAQSLGVDAQFHKGGFEDVATFQDRPFDAILSLGNSLSLIESFEKLRIAMSGFAKALTGPGLLIIQTPNFTRFADPENRWKCLPSDATDESRIAFKHFSPWGDSHYAVEFLTIYFDAERKWSHEIKRSRILNLAPERLEPILADSFEIKERYGHADGRPFEIDSPDCILVAHLCRP